MGKREELVKEIRALQSVITPLLKEIEVRHPGLGVSVEAEDCMCTALEETGEQSASPLTVKQLTLLRDELVALGKFCMPYVTEHTTSLLLVQTEC